MGGEELQLTLYEVRCLATGKSYIGQTRCTLTQRWAKHVWTAMNQPRRGSQAFHAAIRKYGPDGFVLTDIAVVDSVEKANELEVALIAERGTLAPNGYNLDAGGKAHTRTPETRAKIAAANTGKASPLKGKKRPPEVVARIIETRRLRGNLGPGSGRVLSEETRRKISDAHKSIGSPWLKGHSVSEETRRKIGDANRARALNPETKERMRQAARARVAKKRESV